MPRCHHMHEVPGECLPTTTTPKRSLATLGVGT